MLEDVIDTIDLFSGIDLENHYKDRRMRLTLYYRNPTFFDTMIEPLHSIENQEDFFFYMRVTQRYIHPAILPIKPKEYEIKRTHELYQAAQIKVPDSDRRGISIVIPYRYEGELPSVVMDNNFSREFGRGVRMLNSALTDEPDPKDIDEVEKFADNLYWFKSILSDVTKAADSMESISKTCPFYLTSNWSHRLNLFLNIDIGYYIKSFNEPIRKKLRKL